MGQYKVPQNVESEDTILGPLTIKQFVYVIIAIMWGFLCWRVFSVAVPIAILLMLPVSGPLLALGLIRREGQNFETYFIAMIRFMLVPRRRTWLKDDTKAVVVRAPKEMEKQDEVRNPNEVRGELRKLASIVDSRGRIPKGLDVQAADANVAGSALSQRVVTPEAVTIASEIISEKVSAPRNDMLDMQHNPQAVAVGELLKNAEVEARNKAMAAMQHPAEAVPTQAQATSQATPQNAILQRAVQSGAVVSVQQLAQQVHRQNVLQEGQATPIK